MARMDKTQGMAGSEAPPMAGDEVPEEQVSEGGGAQAVWSSEVDLPAESLSIPYLSLLQGLSTPVQNDQAKAGQWFVNGYEPLSEVTLVPLKFGVSRSYSKEVEDKGLETQCYSPTGHEHGIALTDDGPGMACISCPLKEWQPTDKVDTRGRKKNDPPPCKESYDFMAWCVEHGAFVRVGFRSTGLQAGRLLATLGRTKGLGKFAVSLTSLKKTSRFTYFVPNVTILTSGQSMEALAQASEMLALTG